MYNPGALTFDEAGRIAVNVAKLPGFLGRARLEGPALEALPRPTGAFSSLVIVAPSLIR